MDGREQSALMIAKLVALLAGNGVQTTVLSTMEFIGAPEKANDHQPLIDTIKWLEAEGVIRKSTGYSGDVMGDTIFELVLTSRGFWLLDQKLTDDLTLGAAIGKVNGNRNALGGLGDLVGGVLGGFTKSMSSG